MSIKVVEVELSLMKEDAEWFISMFVDGAIYDGKIARVHSEAEGQKILEKLADMAETQGYLHVDELKQTISGFLVAGRGNKKWMN